MRIDWDTVKQVVWLIILTVVIIVVLFFGARKVIYCLQHTGQIDCVIVAGDK